MRASTKGSAFLGSDWLLKTLWAWGPKNPIIFALQCAQHERSNRFSSLVAQNACLDVRKCLLGVWLTFERHWGSWVAKPQNFRRTMRSARTEQPIFIVNGSKCVFWRKEVAFGGLIDLWKNWGRGGTKTPKFSPYRSARTKQPIFIVNSSKCMLRRKEVPFGGPIDFWKKLWAWGPNNPIIFALQCAQHERSNWFSSLMAQNACFDVWKCLLCVWLAFEKNSSSYSHLQSWSVTQTKNRKY